jgi:hypothetical protein
MNNGQIQDGEETQEERGEKGTASQDELATKTRVEFQSPQGNWHVTSEQWSDPSRTDVEDAFCA